MYSDEQIFDTSALQNDSLIKHFPFIDSIFSSLQQLAPEAPDLVFKRVETVFDGLKGIYDYSFSKEIKNGSLVTSWKLIDKTEAYKALQQQQQARQNNIISGHNRYSF